jgi:16S rRNA (uracil1498-N3)-methyltransferase
MRRRFLVDSLEGSSAVVRGSDARHLGRVLRARPGQLYELSDGSAVWLGKVVRVDREAVEFALVGPVTEAAGELPVETTLLLSIVRFARFEWSLEKATEMGAAIVRPVAAVRSERGLVEAAPKRMARWERIAHEASEQSRRLRPPVLMPVERAADAFDKTTAELKLLLSERRDVPSMASLRPAAPPASVALAFGPEGGWTDEELAAAREAGFADASLGPMILRTETAVVAALAVVLCSWLD